MVRETSLDAYEELVASGKMETLKARILKRLIDAYPSNMTRTELSEDLSIPINCVTKPVLILINDRLITEGNARACNVTGKNAYGLVAYFKPQMELF